MATELARLAGGTLALADRASALMNSDIRMACHLVELAVQADPNHHAAHEIRAAIYQHRRNQETSLMARGIYGAAANESKAVITEKNE